MKDYKKLKKIFADDKDMLAQLNHEELMDSLSQKESKSKLKKTIHDVFKGESGYTPQKGVDYFTENEIKEWKDEILTKATPKKFKDYFTNQEVDTIARIMRADLKKEVTPVKNKDYFDGVDGKDANEKEILKKVSLMIPTHEELLAKLPKTKEVDTKSIVKEVLNQIPKRTEITTEQIVKEIKDKRLIELRDIKGARLDNPRGNYSMNDQRWHGGGIDNITGLITAGTNVTITGTGTTADPYIINSSGGGGGTPGGSDTQLQYNNAGSFGGISGATTNGTAVTYTTGNLIAHDVKASQSAGMDILSSNGTVTALFGAGGGANSTFYGGSKFDYATASTIGIFDGSKNLISADTATYPSLTELSYVKGVTSAIQTQLNAKGVGSVTSVAMSVPTGLTISGSPITTTGTLAVALDTGYVIPLQSTLDGKASTALSNLASVAINTSLISDTNNTDDLGSTGIRWKKSWVVDAESTNMPTVGGTSLSSTFLSLAGGTMTGNITLGENASIALDPAGSADGKYTGTTMTGIAGYTQSFGDLVYLDPTDSRWEACDANSAAGADGDSRGMIGMVVVAGTDGNACTILLQGIIRADAKFPTFTVNNPVYVSETAGAVTQTQPVTTDVVIRVVGFGITADEMYFNPDGAYITHT